MNGVQSTNLAATVRAEALATSYHRETARQTATDVGNIRGPMAGAWAVGDKLRELGREMEAERRLDLHRRLATPSDLIATIKADWPEQAASVQAFADAQGIKLGEAWAMLIAETADRLRGGADE